MRYVTKFVLLLSFLGGPATASPRRDKPDDIVASEGALVVSDGSSYFRFEKGGKFHAGPLGISGRTIDGTYTSDGNYTLTIVGMWGWQNGVSALDDHRRMVVTIQPPFAPGTATTVTSAAKNIYHCYWTVDELVKLPSKP
jgi:hypothetical protein